MDEQQELQVQQKRPVEKAAEETVPARYFVPNTDIFETADALSIVMEMPGVEKENVEIRIEKDVLDVEGRIDFSSYEALQPLYTEYNVGHYKRSFSLSSKIDQGKIQAEMQDGLLTLILHKVEEMKPRTIPIR